MLPRHDIVRAVLISSLMPLQCERSKHPPARGFSNIWTRPSNHRQQTKSIGPIKQENRTFNTSPGAQDFAEFEGKRTQITQILNSVLKQSWRYRNGRGKRAYFCAFLDCFCLFTRFTSSFPERETQITGRCATWGSLWAAPRFLPPGMVGIPRFGS